MVAFWLLALIVTFGLSRAIGSDYNESVSLPGTDSQAAVTLLTDNFPAASGEPDQVVFEAERGATVRSPAVRRPVTAALGKVAAVPGVASVVSPYSKPGAAQISRDGSVAFARVTWKKKAADVSKADASRLIAAAKTADGPDVHVSLGGASITNEESKGPGTSVAVGVVAALIILLIVFGGALFSSLMPVLTAALALVVGTSVISLLSRATDTPSVSTDLAVLIGLGVGVDYGLFIISRHRSAVRAGTAYRAAAAEAANTSGRTVLFAGITVCIALLGQYALGVNFLYGLSASSALTVALTMATALTFLPAMLGFLGPKVLSRRERAALAAKGPISTDAAGFWLRWAKAIEAHNAFVAVTTLAIVVVIALPTFSLRLGSAGAANDPATSTTRQAYDALARGFGPGFNGPFQLVGRVSSPADVTAFRELLGRAARTPGVASVTAPVTSPNRQVMLAILYPTTAPGAKQTVTLVSTIRHDLIPPVEAGNSLVVHVGGVTPSNIDFSRVLTDKLPLFIAVVVILAFLLLMAVFRSLLIPLVAAVMNLLSVGAALGALNAVFTWGWANSAFGLSGKGPVDAFIPVLIFSVLFGLSMDYEVYLVSRMQEEWHRRRDHGRPDDRAGRRAAAVRHNHRAVTVGQAKSGRIIAAAAGIMILVFGSFLIGDQRVLKEFGFGLAFAVLVDALVIRGLLVPALMHVFGPANWAMPRKLERVVPNLSFEGPSDGER
ncbi:MMPL family transporter [Streptomyces sp. NBC_01190]|uniref:MMPL family transporter n=1 Tax=Streptomyces sp. NBC_01190 TaxID=2903767 RepID=UPI003868CAB6|nr:MMPL family transporter [Streptomyces sp. NBC_01190]